MLIITILLGTNTSSMNFLSSLVNSFILIMGRDQKCQQIIPGNFRGGGKKIIIYFSECEITDDISCFKLLVCLNSQLGKGKGRSHVALTHRLKQLRHKSLADWLSWTVFHQLGQNLNRTLLMDTFKEVAQTDKTEARYWLYVFITSHALVWKYRICRV